MKDQKAMIVILRTRNVAMLLAAMLACLSAVGQVRTAPQGNSLPEAPHVDAAEAASMPHPFDVHAEPAGAEALVAFARAVDLSHFRRLAVFDEGRAKILDTLAREKMLAIYGKSYWREMSVDDKGEVTAGPRLDPVFTFMDMLIQRQNYVHRPMIYVEVLDLRRTLTAAVVEPVEQQGWLKIARLTPAIFEDARMQQTLAGLESDLSLQKALGEVAMELETFWNSGLPGLAMISPTAQDAEGKWLALSSLAQLAEENPSAKQAAEAWRSLIMAWQKLDAPGVNAQLDELSRLMPAIRGETYPSSLRRGAERLYNATGQFTIGFWAYFLGAVGLLVALGTGRRTMLTWGIGATLLGLLVHTAGLVVRSMLANRGWLPLHNQYESFIALSWFAVVVGLLLAWWRKQVIFAAAGAALGTFTLLFANLVPIPANQIGQVAGILATSNILKIHVTTVMASYGLISLGFFVSLCYLGAYYFRGGRALAIAGAAVAMTTEPAENRSGSVERLLHDLDAAQMVVLQLAFWILGVGILLGAYWADHAWGRWWGWDPKETWALITWIVYLIVIHVRMGVKQRGITTAWLSVVGFGVMLWTYWGVNLLIAGLHSYAQ
ncbi:MAG: cytochrome c biogenesis protein CcsA [Phycisphaeraceae bacterium]|nr:cytochrome c biogenesis protein CcsA [Phycisphaeraceae bacterium]